LAKDNYAWKGMDMIERKDFLALNFYEKSPFCGSFNHMHYKIEKIKEETEEGEIKKLKVTYWPGPYASDKTPDSLKQSELFEFSDEGLKLIAAFLNEQYIKQKELWDTVKIY
jgi:hypothetical protein